MSLGNPEVNSCIGVNMNFGAKTEDSGESTFNPFADISPVIWTPIVWWRLSTVQTQAKMIKIWLTLLCKHA